MEADHIAMPPKVAGAVAAVMAEVPKLTKGEKNTHGSYNFASIDDFLEAVRPLCAKHGLIIMQDEESFDMAEGWLVLKFRYTLIHSSGETWGHRPTRTIMVNAKMGSQAFGAAQSYSLKQFERSLFQIATGEKGADDADSHPPADLPAVKAKSAPPKSAAPAPLTGQPREIPDEDWIAFGSTLVATLKAQEDSDIFEAWVEANAEKIEAMAKANEKAHARVVQVIDGIRADYERMAA